MPKPLSMSAVPATLRKKLDAKLRSNGYSDFVALSAWMKEQGISIGKSSIHRYAIRLRMVDAEDRLGMAAVLQKPSTPAGRLRQSRSPKMSDRRSGIDTLISGLNPVETALLEHFRKLDSDAQSELIRQAAFLSGNRPS